MNAIQQCLVDAKALIPTPDKWCKGAEALDAAGRIVDRDSPEACRWCAGGATYHCDPTGEFRMVAMGKLEKAAGVGGWQFPVWQDVPERTHAEVMAAFDRAIELAGQQLTPRRMYQCSACHDTHRTESDALGCCPTTITEVWECACYRVHDSHEAADECCMPANPMDPDQYGERREHE